MLALAPAAMADVQLMYMALTVAAAEKMGVLNGWLRSLICPQKETGVTAELLRSDSGAAAAETSIHASNQRQGGGRCPEVQRFERVRADSGLSAVVRLVCFGGSAMEQVSMCWFDQQQHQQNYERSHLREGGIEPSLEGASPVTATASTGHGRQARMPRKVQGGKEVPRTTRHPAA
ncbi:hypothetical protein B0T10DRAFT_145091 [Thelonectria olida]|uniref:Uncharacterized protein n=1 Tax=Thelonectria olida TaxID=1576542 RepID=A0A9P9AN86_9HYPO|nr:hypothetical protein B0T10DRAFT_145091 [Thelonectria olida]